MANDVYRLVLVGSVAEESFENVLMYQANVASAANPADTAQALITAWMGTVADDFLACCPNDLNIFGSKCSRINNTGGPVVMAPSAAMPGTRPAASVTSSVGPVIVSSYVEGTKHRAGRIFIAGIADGDMIQNEFAAGLLTALGTLHTTLATALISGAHTWNYGIWSKVHTAFHIPDTIQTSLKPGLQGRRLKPIL